MNLLLLSAALTVVAAALAAIWAGLRPLPDDEPTERDRLHHTTTCRCPREPEGAPA